MKGLKKQRRIQIIVLAFVALALSTALIGYALRDGINYFRAPSQVAEEPPGPDEVFRIGTRGYIWSGEPLPAGRTVEYRYASVALDGTVSEWGPPVPFAVPLPGTADEGVFE